MDNKLSIKWLTSPSLLRLLAIVLLVIGVIFRFVNLDKKIYSSDEVYSSLRISGYMQSEIEQDLRSGNLIGVKDFLQYQYPNSEKNITDVIKGIVIEDSQILPLHVLITRFWVQLFGNSIAVTRSFSAVVSLLTFPCIYWLCKELFESSLIGWIAMAFVAISPVHLVYAQEARAYGLWIVATLMSSAALLGAIRVKTKVSWCIYAATLLLGFYSHIFFCFIAVGQGIYALAIERFRLSKTLISYFISSLAAFLAFLPWLWIIITNPHPEAVTWANNKQTLFASVSRWAGIIGRGFIDLGISPTESSKVQIILIPLFLISVIIIYSIYILCRKTPKRVWLFVLTLIGSVSVPLAIADFVFQKRYGTTRYLLPSILGVELAFAYLFTTKITSIYLQAWQKKLWSLLALMIVSIGIVSCSVNSQANIWWSKVPERFGSYPKIANIVLQAEKPLLITDASVIPTIQILVHLLDEKVKFQVLSPNQLPQITSGFSDIFLFHSSDELKAGIEKIYNSKLVKIDDSLWKIEKSS
ncbi:MAG: glycosyltransferase family 39 protein [Nostoc sp. ChiSLP02]|nr:glycosyltransferase family 39 protein [Nostoc sp. DedSLP05]MDZ8101723.1 glycosyltransferase family 39 protein [Nostoc sp. DedSLP01]MDZ8185003.1 glycosyltransferase family 39 protein [Nostoc sp. ChiSLP02]